MPSPSVVILPATDRSVKHFRHVSIQATADGPSIGLCTPGRYSDRYTYSIATNEQGRAPRSDGLARRPIYHGDGQ